MRLLFCGPWLVRNEPWGLLVKCLGRNNQLPAASRTKKAAAGKPDRSSQPAGAEWT
jgi:hypothetical protein